MIREGAQSQLVVTGCGTINALGRDVESFWARLVQGAGGIRVIPNCFRASPDVLAAAVTDPLPSVDIDGPVSRTDRLALIAAEEAIHQASLTERHNRARVGIVLGTTTGGIREVEDSLVERGAGKASRLARLLVFEMANASDVLAERFGLSGPRYTLHTACASGASAILLGAELILGGMADAVLAGGSDALTRLTLSGFRSLRALDPEPCRPFAKDRRGMSLGEGAGFVVLEDAARAASRGVRPYAELAGYGLTTDAYHMTAPRPDAEGSIRAMIDALDRARIPAALVGYVNAHGTGTLQNDRVEALALRKVFDPDAVLVSASKSLVGHTMAAAGALEGIATILALVHGLVPPTAHLAEPDPEIPFDCVPMNARRVTLECAMSNSFGFGGQNLSLVFRTVPDGRAPHAS